MKKNVSQRMFIFVMITTVIVVLATTRRESYNPWLPWNWFRKPERPRPRPRPMPERPRPRPMPEPPRPRPMPERPYPMPERPRPMDPHLALIPEHKMRPPDASELIFSNRPAQPISPGVRARMEPR
jgi:hypothetical protein